jgi:ABC-type transport system involved in cytochrome bd biosynthesis fused ATPase/permease subunit
MKQSRASTLSTNTAALILSLMVASIAAIRPLVLATIFGGDAVHSGSSFLDSVVKQAASTFSIEYIIVALMILAVLEVGAFSIGFLTDILILIAGTRVGRQLRSVMARSMLGAMSTRRSEEIVNSYISRVRADVDVVEQYHKISLIPSLAALAQIALSIIIAATLSVVMAELLILEVTIILLLVWLYSNVHARLSLERLAAEERLGKGAQLYMRAALAIWFGRIGGMWLRHRLGDARALARARLRFGVGTAGYHNLVSFLLGVTIVLGGFLIFRDGNNVAARESFFVFVLYSGFLLGPVIRLVSFVPETREYRTAIARAAAPEESKSRRTEPDMLSNKINHLTVHWKQDGSERQGGGGDKSSGGWTIETGDKVAVIGESGTGKTSLLELILGARDSPHSCALLNGRNTAEMSHLMPLLGIIYLTDSPRFESGTISQNCIGESLNAVRLLKAVHLIDDENQGIKFLRRAIDRNGEPLSLGERQRVQLVRALLMRPKWLAMDEALSGIAQEAEERIIQWLCSEELKDATVLYVSHRPRIQALFPRQIRLNYGKGLARLPCKEAA